MEPGGNTKATGAETPSDTRLWRIAALLSVPRGVRPDVAGNLKFFSRLPDEMHCVFHATDIRFLRPTPSTDAFPSPGDLREHWRLDVDASAPDAISAIQRVVSAIESALDHLAFRFQEPVPIEVLEALDLTPPVASGDQREYLLFPAPSGYRTPKFVRTSFMGSDPEPLALGLSDSIEAAGPWARAALHWYVKSLAAPFDPDRFICAWVSLEILEGQLGERTPVPYMAPCGHLIVSCPTCGKKTAKKTAGASLKKFLVERGGLSEVQAAELWKTRQILHGANDFDDPEAYDLAGRLHSLLAVTSRVLKEIAGMPASAPPFLDPQAGGMSNIYLVGTRAVAAADLV